MELGATVCLKRAPACHRCPVASLCAASGAGRAAEVPEPQRRPARRPLVLACAVVRRGGAILLARRPSGGLFGGLWAPPSAAVEPGEDARAVLARGLSRDHGGRWAVGEEVAACERTLTHRVLTLRAFPCERSGRIATGDALRWMLVGSLDGCGVPSAVRALLGRVPEPGEEPGAGTGSG
jgi:A/G-specific adenine glycosylase